MSARLLERRTDIAEVAPAQAGEEVLAVRALQPLNDVRALCEESHAADFRPAFLDTHTGSIYLSRFLNGQIAPMHFLDALPSNLIESDPSGGQAIRLKAFVIAGYVTKDQFYTRDEAAKVTQDAACP